MAVDSPNTISHDDHPAVTGRRNYPPTLIMFSGGCAANATAPEYHE